ncbi:MAG: hypothetical protein QOJ29_4882, partial [Thermoleophilaceae bacterium]|nr:hypothetical protein [Thermoleophilaceae bacterium]
HVSFVAGPTHKIKETVVRSSARPAFAPGNAPVEFTIGPVDFPDTAKDMAATGARFLNAQRGYSGTSMNEVEHYCLDCSFRPWLDASKQLFVTVGGKSYGAQLGSDGRFTSGAVAKPGASVVVRDAWGDSAAPATVG